MKNEAGVKEESKNKPKRIYKGKKYWNFAERRKYLFFIYGHQDKILDAKINNRMFVKMASYINSKGKGAK